MDYACRIKPCHATTLIEILAVLATVSILCALSLPAINSTLARTQQFQCAGNLKQWGLATHLYALENDDFLPRDGTPNGRSHRSGWYINLPHQLNIPDYHESAWRSNPLAVLPRSIWLCPANRRRSNGHNLFHYCLNQHINGKGSGNQVKLSNLKAIDRLVWIFDNGGQAAVAQHNNVHTNIHRKGANFLFLDGHVSHRESHEYWDYDRNIGISKNPTLQWIPE